MASNPIERRSASIRRGAAAVTGAGVLATALVAFAARMASQPAIPSGPGGSPSLVSNLFKVYMPRVFCMYQEWPVVWLHLVSDTVIGLAYYSIPVALVYFVRKRRDLSFNWVFFLFAGFILACGTTHFIAVWDLWQPLYKVDGLVKGATALLSIGTAIALWPFIPVALTMPSPAQLEQKVAERTKELEALNQELVKEVEARMQAERDKEELLRREQAARGEAEAANRLKDDFLATLSHELRTPLTAILGWSNLLKRKTVREQHYVEALDIIERNAMAQTSLIDDLLDMSRIVSGKMSLAVQNVDLGQVVRAAIETVSPLATSKDIKLKEAVEDRLLTTGDPNRLQQVVWNLLSNAIKFTPQGGSVEVSLAKRGDEAVLTVKDTGHGISPDFLPHVFKRFEQADSSISRKFSGLGIGLAIVKNITEMHGGTVKAECDGPGRGSTFTVTLPVRAGTQETQDSSPNGKPVLSAPGGRLSGALVMVVDDEPDTRSLLKALLEDHGAEVQLAGTAKEALRLLGTSHPDLILSDIGLPDEDGYELLRQIRSRKPSEGGLVPAVAVSAFARPEDRIRALKVGFHSHIGKPIHPDELVALVANFIGKGSGESNGG